MCALLASDTEGVKHAFVAIGWHSESCCDYIKERQSVHQNGLRTLLVL